MERSDAASVNGVTVEHQKNSRQSKIKPAYFFIRQQNLEDE
ncbi:MAG: hypothetical protein ACOXZO_11940 [Bacteroidales bacterium]